MISHPPYSKCFTLVSLRVINTMTRSNVGKKGFLSATSTSVHHQGKQGRNLDQKPWRNAAYHHAVWIALIEPRPTCLWMALPTLNSSPYLHTHQSSVKSIPQTWRQSKLICAIPQWRFPLSRDLGLYEVDNKTNQNTK